MSGRNTSTSGVSRRGFIKGALASAGTLALAGAGFYRYFWRARNRQYPGAILGASAKVGHLLRGASPTPPETEERFDTVIVGSGIAALSAAWWLKKQGHENFCLLELEPAAGGNSQCGKNDVSAYPWGAHYLPLPGADATLVRELLAELNVIKGYDEHGQPIYDEFYLGSDPLERLYLQGRWQDGLVPQIGISAADRADYDAFFKFVEGYKKVRGRDGRRAFSIPMELSSRDPELLALDEISMDAFLDQRGWKSRNLRWYVNYCCRDDYGMGCDKVSAWAGIHYFASRDGVGANANNQAVLTWPEGNGWLMSHLRDKVADKIRLHSLAYNVETHADHAIVDYVDVNAVKKTRLRARHVIFAAPRFVAAHVIGEFRQKRPDYLASLQYAPWMVANITLRTPPSGKGVALCWDNVSYYSESLGYVVATHQDLSRYPKPTVITYYMPLDKQAPAEARGLAIQKTHHDWSQEIADDLERMHPGIKDEIQNIDVWVWGHGMISPGINHLWSKSRQAMLAPLGRIHFAHTDMSGISIFEEAQYRGVEAAKGVLAAADKGRPA